MALVRVYQPPGDLEVQIVIPNERLRAVHESDAALLARVCARAEQATPALRDYAHVDVDPADLPAERVRRVSGRKYDVRGAWRVSGRRVVVDEAKVAER